MGPGPEAPVVHEISLPRPTTVPNTKHKDSVFTLRRKKPKTPAKEKLSKQDIGIPFNSIHVSGIKSSASGFEMVNNSNLVDPKIAAFLNVAGLNESILQDQTQRDKIYAFVEENKVLEKIRQPSKRHHRAAGERPEIVHTVDLKEQKPTPTQASPRLPPKSYQKRTHSPSVTRSNAPTPPSKSQGGAPPPPPPPPPPPAPGPPPPPLSMSKPSPQKPAAKISPAKGDFLAEIRQKGGFQGAGLNSVKAEAAGKRPPSVHEQEDLTAVLQQALQIIQTANRSSDESDGSDVDSNGSWSEEDC